MKQQNQSKLESQNIEVHYNHHLLHDLIHLNCYKYYFHTISIFCKFNLEMCCFQKDVEKKMYAALKNNLAQPQ